MVTSGLKCLYTKNSCLRKYHEENCMINYSNFRSRKIELLKNTQHRTWISQSCNNNINFFRWVHINFWSEHVMSTNCCIFFSYLFFFSYFCLFSSFFLIKYKNTNSQRNSCERDFMILGGGMSFIQFGAKFKIFIQNLSLPLKLWYFLSSPLLFV